MKIVILSKRARSYSTERLIQAARGRGHKCLAIDPEDCSLVLEPVPPEEPRPMQARRRSLAPRASPKESKTPGKAPPAPIIRAVLYYKSRRLLNTDLAIPRLGAIPSEFTVSALQCFEALGVPSLNAPDAITHARDRFRSLRALAEAGLRVPPTLLARRPEEIGRKIALLGGPPVIVRLAHGTQNVGAIVAEQNLSIVSIVESFWEAGKNILLQKFDPDSGGREVRAWVCGGRVIGAVRRAARVGGWRVKPHVPRESVSIELGRAQRELAIRAAEALHLDIAGVDLFDFKGQATVLEVNPAPGLEEIERASGVDVALEVIRYAEEMVKGREGK